MESASAASEKASSHSDEEWVSVAKNLSYYHLEGPKSHQEVSTVTEKSFYTALAEAAYIRLQEDTSPIFTPNLPEGAIWKTFLSHLPDDSMRQRFSCNACRHFISNFGGLAQVVEEDGRLKPLLWPASQENVPEGLRASIKAMYQTISSASVLTELKPRAGKKTIGTRISGGYNHFYLTFPDCHLHNDDLNGFAPIAVPGLAAMLDRIMQDYSKETVGQAATMLLEDKLPYADNHKAAIRWLRDLHENKNLETARHNLLYLYAASSFTGCLSQLRSGALSTLLNNIQIGKGFKRIEHEWWSVCDPLLYLRPQAAPTASHIAVAERLMQTLGITENDMRRKELTHSEIPESVVMWARKKHCENKSSSKPRGIFSKLKPRAPGSGSSPSPSKHGKISHVPPTPISFTQFMTSVLPNASKLEYHLAARSRLYFCITGLEGTKPLMQWHCDQNRASWFTYRDPLPVKDHGLRPDTFSEVSCIIPFPHLWDGAPVTTTLPLLPAESEQFRYYHKNHGFRYLLCLDNITLESGSNLSLCLFPTVMKSKFHGVRRTIEAFSNENHLERVPDIEEKGGLVGGVEIDRAQRDKEHLLRVTDAKGCVNTYKVVLFE